ncbi:MAG: prepilin-type N-terminal cleavage/methylation domain-containing protein [Peptostreptococcaceae bacterium]|nr:prepilin-type N-terminal cleavage/methylation domain-containing protein [Peptostreptococcaceae bacterium]
MQKKYKYNGFTLVEILIAIAILSILVASLVFIMGDSIKTHKNTSDLYTIQTNVVYTSNSLNEAVRESTAIFVLAENKYNPANITEDKIAADTSTLGLTEQWNYIGPNAEKTKIYNFVWDPVKKVHIPFELTVGENVKGKLLTDISTLAPGKYMDPKIRYGFSITDQKTNIQKQLDYYKTKSTLTEAEKREVKLLNERLSDQRSVLNYSIDGYRELITVNTDGTNTIEKDTLTQHITNASVEALNTKQIIDISEGRTPTAIAYRTTPIKDIEKAKKPAVALVLDFSSSMTDDLDAYNYRYKNNKSLKVSVHWSHVALDAQSYQWTRNGRDVKYRVSDGTLYYMKRTWNSAKGDYDYYAETNDGTGRRLSPSQLEPIPQDQRRLAILKRQYKDLVKRFAALGDVNLYVVPFAEHGENPRIFRNISQSNGTSWEVERDKFIANLPFTLTRPATATQDQKKENLAAENGIEKMTFDDWTNYADGVRIGLSYLEKEKRTNSNPNGYLLVLSDGQPNKPDRNNLKDPVIRDRFPGATGAMTAIDAAIKNAGYTPKLVHLIGFSNVAEDNKQLEKIKGYFINSTGLDNAKVVVYKTGTDEELEKAFKKFVEDVEHDLWYFNGP